MSLAGRFDCALAQGAAFAAKARQLAGNEVVHTEEACAALAAVKAEQAAALCDRALAQVDENFSSPYREWRELVQNYFSSIRNPLRGNSHEAESFPIVGFWLNLTKIAGCPDRCGPFYSAGDHAFPRVNVACWPHGFILCGIRSLLTHQRHPKLSARCALVDRPYVCPKIMFLVIPISFCALLWQPILQFFFFWLT